MDQFEILQQKLVAMWKEIGSTVADPEDEERCIVVVPSLGIDLGMSAFGQQAYEERLLFMLFLLRKPRIRMIYVTSLRIQPEIIDYYLQLLPGVVLSNARQRLSLLAPQDGSSATLSEKLLQRPALMSRLRSLIPDLNQAHMVPFHNTDPERELAVALGIPMYAADPRFFAFGTKSGCRRLFAEEDVPHPIGYEDVNSTEMVVWAIAKIRAERPDVRRVVVKLNEGVSGLGNAIVDVADLPATGSQYERDAIHNRLRAMKLEAGGGTVDEYLAQLTTEGAIVEAFVTGAEVRSPSVQMRCTPLGAVEVLSTHDQMLGGPSGQSYLGASFPADPAYSVTIVEEALKVGRRLAAEGVMGRFAIDFVVVRTPDGGWVPYAIEINLRKGGTTAPYLILEYLTNGAYDYQNGVFTTAKGHPKYYVASDHVESPAYRVFTPNHLFDIVSKHRLHYNHATETGVVMQLITGVAELGRVGVTAISDSPAAARALYERFVAVLDEEAAAIGASSKPTSESCR